MLGFLLCVAARASAFVEPTQFFDPSPNVLHAATLGPSAEGIYFTGAPRFTMQTCQNCHTNGPGLVRLSVGADDASLFADGYEPGKTYELTVAISNESEGLAYDTATCTDVLGDGDTYTYVQCNNNSFAFEADADDAPLVGSSVFCSAAPTNGACPAADFSNDQVVVAPTHDAVFANRQFSADPNTPKLITRNDPTSWHFWWTAPIAGTGTVTFYAAAVDGNGGSGTTDRDQDPYGDDTVQESVTIPERGAAATATASAGCSYALARHAVPIGGACMMLIGAFAVFCILRRRAR